MMQHKFEDICGYVSPKGFAKLERIAQDAARVG